MSGYSGFDVLTILASLFILAGSPERDPAGKIFSIVPHQLNNDSCGQSVLAGLSGRYPEKLGDMSLLDMEEALLVSGIHSRTVELTLEELLPLAHRNYPVVILLSRPTWHYALLIGHDREMAVIADPSEGTIALEVSRLGERFSGYAIVPLLGDDDLKHLAAGLGTASKAALGRASFIRRKLDLEIADAWPGKERGAQFRVHVAQSFSIGRGISFMAEVSSKPSARLELGGTMNFAGSRIEAGIGVLLESSNDDSSDDSISDSAPNPHPYARAEWSLIRDPFAYYLGIRGSGNLEASTGLIYAVNDRAAFEAGLRLNAEGWKEADWKLDAVGGVHLALGAVMCTIIVRTSLEGSGGSVALALNF